MPKLPSPICFSMAMSLNSTVHSSLTPLSMREERCLSSAAAAASLLLRAVVAAAASSPAPAHSGDIMAEWSLRASSARNVMISTGGPWVIGSVPIISLAPAAGAAGQAGLVPG